MRLVNEAEIKAHSDRRFRSEYDYALFEYYRSAKVFAFLERAGVGMHGRALDAGCGVGQYTIKLLQDFAPAKVVSLDLTRGQVARTDPVALHWRLSR